MNRAKIRFITLCCLSFGLVLLLALSACNQAESVTIAESGSTVVHDLPKLVDVGADKCIPCIKMAPILDQLRKDYIGQLEVVFVDVWKFRDEAAKYRVQMIPTQIFYAADGSELYRHTGFYGREEILGKWRELGFNFKVKN
ncbi:MAG: thioredoxin family protein [Desulfuromonadales bacterium]|nr:thioredoxin family protein [Desulfuromonadales bacterium]